MIEIKKQSTGGILTKTGTINGSADVTMMKATGINLISATPDFQFIQVVSWIFYFPPGLSVIDDTFYLYGNPYNITASHINALASFTIIGGTYISGNVFTGMKGGGTINSTTHENAGYGVTLYQDTDVQSLYDGLIHYKI